VENSREHPGRSVRCPEREGKPQGELNSGQKSAEGIVVEGNEPGAETPV